MIRSLVTLSEAVFALTLAAAGSAAASPRVPADPAPGAPAPAIFAPGVISAGAIDGAPTFSPDGKTLYFERTNSQITAILESRRTSRGWTKPVLAAFSGPSSDQQPTFSPDGRYLVFVSTRQVAASGAAKTYASHLYRVDRRGSGWGTPVELPSEVNISHRVFKPSIAANGDLYFMSDIGGGGSPKWRLFRAARRGTGYAPAEPLGFSGPDDADVDPYIDPAQRFVIFSSASRSSLKDGHEHLFIAMRDGAGWSAPRPLRYDGDAIGADDGEAQVSPDGQRLYFTSSRVLPVPRERTRAAVVAALSRMEGWDNSNSNVWSLPLAGYLASATGQAASG